MAPSYSPGGDASADLIVVRSGVGVARPSGRLVGRSDRSNLIAVIPFSVQSRSTEGDGLMPVFDEGTGMASTLSDEEIPSITTLVPAADVGAARDGYG